ncbi:oligosaccharide flippase family protein [Shimia sp. SDUM112013]|uniref:oligosaccharide flippase family protein n=1 Tax=Shimia sp. SDUM112013 TaxID=3136160 RepID=UPI0032EF736F
MRWIASPPKRAADLMAGFKTSGRALAWGVPILAEAAALGRSIALAWTIGAGALGQAMMLALVLRLIEMTSDLGVERLIVQAPEGATRRLQAGLQGVALIRGTIMSLVLLALSPVLAWAFVDGPSVAAYASLSIVPLLGGFMHLDYRRAERRFAYRQMAVVEGGATLMAFVALIPAIWVFADYRVMAAVLICHAVARVALSHMVATRRYRLLFSTDVMLRCWRFGAPLIVNAALLFLVFYADRLIVARGYGWATLALYGVVLQLALLPAQIVGRAAGSLVLPSLRETLGTGAFQAVWQRILTRHAILAAALVLAFTALAPVLIALVYGPEFRPEAGLALAVAVAAGFRILRTPYSQLAVAMGRTADPARANLLRVLALPLAAFCAATGGPLTLIAVAAAVGEVAATLRAVQLAGGHSSNTSQKEMPA